MTKAKRHIEQMLVAAMLGAMAAALFVAAGRMAGPTEPPVLRAVPLWHGISAGSSHAVPQVVRHPRAESARSGKAA
jgi:hypothetical protein